MNDNENSKKKARRSGLFGQSTKLAVIRRAKRVGLCKEIINFAACAAFESAKYLIVLTIRRCAPFA